MHVLRVPCELQRAAAVRSVGMSRRPAAPRRRSCNGTPVCLITVMPRPSAGSCRSIYLWQIRHTPGRGVQGLARFSATTGLLHRRLLFTAFTRLLVHSDRWCSTVASMVPTHLARAGALWRSGRPKCQIFLAYTPGTFLPPTALSRTRCSETCRNGMRARASRCPGHRNQYGAGLLLASMWKQASGDASMSLWRASAHSFKSRLQRCRWTRLTRLGLASHHLAEATAREYRHVLRYFRTSRACAWSVIRRRPWSRAWAGEEGGSRKVACGSVSV